MLCWECGAEMRLIQVTEDTTMLVSGYEHHTWQCSGCSTVERRMTFTRKKTLIQALPVEPAQTAPVELIQMAQMPVETTQAVPLEQTQAAPVEKTAPVQAAQTVPTRPEPPATMLETNDCAKAFDAKLRNLQARATALREAVAEVERRAQFKREWDNFGSVASHSLSSEALSRVKPDEPARSPAEPVPS
jgi:hypothetical protein